MPRAIIFDLDGTLIELTLPLEKMRSKAKEFYIEKGMPASLLEPADGISSSTAKAREFFLSNGTSLEEWAAMQDELDVLMATYEQSSANDVSLIDGALETVEYVRSKGIRTAILTNNSRPAMDIILNRIPLNDYFEIIHTRNESPLPKPNPDGLLHLSKLLDIAPSDVVYVGDAMIDGVAAKRAGVRFWGIASGETSSSTLAATGAEVVMGSIEEIKTLLNRMAIC